MLIDRVVINASPLIVVFKSDQAMLLPQLFQEIYLPSDVYGEIVAGKDDLASQQVPQIPWLKPVEIPIHPTIAAWDLGAGESSVLSFALAHPEYRAIVDDAAARRCARTLGIKTLGTGGVMVLAKRRGLIDSVGDRLQRLRDEGLWLSDSVIELLKQQAGE
jgi:predicted nucleic acid-binding protein